MDTAAEYDFRPGDRVSYCDEVATVVVNEGDSGWVALDETVHVRWRWHAFGEDVKLVTRQCAECEGTGGVDSGGVTPWGAGIMLPCPACKGVGQITPELEMELRNG